jgi:putative CocE/NonD family hydrolase
MRNIKRYSVLAATLLFLIFSFLIVLQVKPIRHYLSDMRLSLRHGMQRTRALPIKMRDGIHLSTDLYFPSKYSNPLPAILLRNTYGGMDLNAAKLFTHAGYAVVFQHVRGRFLSEGTYGSPHHMSRQDGYDTVDWITRQPWSNGKVGSFGCSFLGESQLFLAAARHPAHICAIVEGAGGAIGSAKNSYNYFGIFENGVLNLATAVGWFSEHGASTHANTPFPDDLAERIRDNLSVLPVSDIIKSMVSYETGLTPMLNQPLGNEWWQKSPYISDDDSFSTAVLHINSWFDQTAADTFRLFELMAENAVHPRAKNQHLIIGPGLHCNPGNSEKFGSGRKNIGELSYDYTLLPYSKIYLDWFDHWLKGKDVPLPPKIQYFNIHANQWLRSDIWPLENIKQKQLYLTEAGELNAETGTNSKRSYIYDPDNPVPTSGGTFCCTGNPDDLQGSVKQTDFINRTDVLTFESTPNESDIDLIGSVKVHLYVSTTSPDTDFTVKLIDIYPDGSAYNLHDGVIRMKYRNGISEPSLLVPNKVYSVTLTLRPIAYRFLKDHRIGLHVSSSNFPRLSRNLNTGDNNLTTSARIIAHNTLHLGNDTPSSIVLPIIPKD